LKKKLIVAGFLLAGIIGFAGTCTVKNVSLTKIGSNDVFAGELANDSGVNILGHRYLVAFLDSNGSVLETKTVEGCLRSLQNGESDFFSAKSSQPSSQTTVGLARLAFDANFKVGTVDSGSATFSGVTVARKHDTDLVVKGTVKNTDSTKLEAPTVCVVVYDNNDKVVLVAKDESLSDLAKNATDTFDVEVTVPDSTSLVDHVDIYVDGEHDGVPVAPESKLNNNVTECNATSTPTSTAGAGTATATNTALPSSTPTNTPGPGTATATPVTPAAATATPVCN
jgi:hypothetical protein